MKPIGVRDGPQYRVEDTKETFKHAKGMAKLTIRSRDRAWFRDQALIRAGSRSCRAHEMRPSRRTDAQLQAGAYRLIKMLRACTRVFATS